jgi:hypothetical protein
MHDDDRDRLAGLLDALDASASALRRDECGDWMLRGSRGHIQGPPEAFYLCLVCHSPLAWTWAKKRLAFCRITQNGDDEGILRLDRLPSPEEATEIRDLLGIRKRYSEAELQARRERGIKRGFQPVHSPNETDR